MRFNEEGFEESFVCFDLPLKLVIFFWSEPRLVRIGHQVIQIHFGAVSAQNRTIKSALLQPDGIWMRLHWHGGDHGYEASGIALSSAAMPIIELISFSRSALAF